MITLPIPYRDFKAMQNSAYRGTRCHDIGVPQPCPNRYTILRSLDGGPIRVDIYRAGLELIVIVPRPTDWDDFSSYAPNIALSRSRSISQAIENVVRCLSETDINNEKIAILGSSQAGYLSMVLGSALATDTAFQKDRLSVTTFNSAPPIGGFSDLEAAIGSFTTNYRTAFDDSAPNLLGYRLGDYVTMLGPLPGQTFEVAIQPVGPALPSRKMTRFPYASLHADLYLLPDDEKLWQMKEISQVAHRNPDLRIAAAIDTLPGDHNLETIGGVMRLIAAGLMRDARRSTHGCMDPCFAAQLENLIAFSKRRPNSWRWRVLGRLASQLRYHLDQTWANTVVRGGEMVVAMLLKVIGEAIVIFEKGSTGRGK